jgi:hypothetical protein
MPFDNPHQEPIGDIAVLMDARARISDADCWLKHAFQEGNHLCLVAALSLACNSRSFEQPSEAERRLAGILVKRIRKGGYRRWLVFLTPRYRLIMFNDHPRTEHNDVVALFARTIEHLVNRAPLAAGA